MQLQREPTTPVSFLDADQIRTATFVRHVELHETLGSTNERAAELAQSSAIELPALVATRLQTAGRGRGCTTWWAADGALTFSLLLDAAAVGLAPDTWPQLSLATAVAVCDALELQIATPSGYPGLPNQQNNPQSEIPNSKSCLGVKWPNDVLLAGRKVCGILIESPGGSTPAKLSLVIGIGVNVNNSWRTAPVDISTGGTALCDFTSQVHNLQSVMASVLNSLSTRLDQLQRRDTELVLAWQQLDVLAGKRVIVQSDRRRLEGQCAGIAPDGALVVNTDDGTHRLYSGSVRLA